MVKPLPCPFCGETPVIGPIDHRAEGDAWAEVACENADCEVQPEFKNWENIAASGAKGSKEQKRIAVSKWNKMLRSHSPTSGDSHG